MRLFEGRPILSVAVVGALAAVLVVMAVLQYRWSGQVSEFDRERLEAGLETSAGQFRREFTGVLFDICSAFQAEPAALERRVWSVYARRYEEWLLRTPWPLLLANLYLWETGAEGEPQPLRLNLDTGRFEAAPAGAKLSRLRERLEAMPFHRRGFRGRTVRPYAWMLAGQTPFLVQTFPPRLEGPPGAEPPGIFLIELNLDYLRREFLPDLAQRHFGGSDGLVYEVAVVEGAGAEEFVYVSDPALSPADLAKPDSRHNLLMEPREYFLGDDPRKEAHWRGPSPMVIFWEESARWELLARHPKGSLDTVVTGLRRRNLAISFGILMLLAASMAMILAATRRAQRLAKLRMDFAAGVSHELRTPLAVIRSAADNLAEGVVGSPARAKEYGALIRGEARRLTEMVEQALQFAAGQPGVKRYHLQPVQVPEIVLRTMTEAQPMIHEAGVTTETDFQPALPPAKADAAALSQCLHNLISNAVKYGGASGWLAVRVRAAEDGGRPEVSITVEDRGPGIDREEVRRIFEPFYRGRAGAGARVHGAGLGLSLVKEAVEGMGGRISVRSKPGQGTAFTLHLPVAAVENPEPQPAKA